MFLHKSQTVIGEVINDKTFSLNYFSIVLQHGRMVVAPMPGTKTIVVIKTPPVGMIGILHPIVPFAIGCCAVASSFKDLRNSGLIHIEPFSTPPGTVYTPSEMIAAGQQFSPGGRTDCAYIKIFQ